MSTSCFLTIRPKILLLTPSIRSTKGRDDDLPTLLAGAPAGLHPGPEPGAVAPPPAQLPPALPRGVRVATTQGKNTTLGQWLWAHRRTNSASRERQGWGVDSP
jgi:hypothetical protein